jgi:transketolase
MRNEFCSSLVAIADDPGFVFLTGDLGFKALEPLRDAAGSRFINAGVAEQNMVSVAAGLAQTGLRPWVYSIAPFVYARPYEQIRNDVCLHNLPVKLVGNGGGYGYGVMGSTHHALEDYGALLCLPNMHVFVPALAADVPAIVHKLLDFPYPVYFRLGAAEEPKDMELPLYAPWRKLLSGGGPTMLAVGPLVGPVLAAARELDDAHRPDLWVLAELPLHEVPAEFLADLERSGHLFVIEEHVAQGGAGQILAHHLLAHGHAPRRFTHRAALGYVSGLYGSQKFHRAECGLDAQSIIALLNQDQGSGVRIRDLCP